MSIEGALGAKVLNMSDNEKEHGDSEFSDDAQPVTPITGKSNKNKLYYYNEFYRLAHGIKWFGTGVSDQIIISEGIPNNASSLYNMSQFVRWNQISKYFLPSRTGEFLRLEFINISNCPEKFTKFSRILLSLPDFKSSEELSL